VKKTKEKKKNEKKSKADPQIKVEETHEMHQYKYTPEELLGISRELAGHLNAITTTKKQQKSVLSQFGTDLTVLESKIAAATQRLTDGFETRSVPCEIRWNYTTNHKIVVRMDSREIVRDTEIPESERQVELPLKEKTPDQLVADAKAAVKDAEREIDKRSQTLKAPLTADERKVEEATLQNSGLNW